MDLFLQKVLQHMQDPACFILRELDGSRKIPFFFICNIVMNQTQRQPCKGKLKIKKQDGAKFILKLYLNL